MDAVSDWSAAKSAQIVDEAWLLGQPNLHRYLSFVRDKVVDGNKVSRSTLIDEWRVANDYYAELEKAEAGLADQVEIQKLPASTKKLASAVKRDSRFQRAFDELPCEFAMVQLDRVMVSQQHVDLTHAARIASYLPAQPSADDLFRFCFPIGGKESQVRYQKTGSDRFVFWSLSSDFRFHEAVALKPEQIVNHQPYGSIGSVLALMVGYGSNFLNVIESDGRLLLHNGHHRAYALRSLGVTHAPCLIRKVSRRDELNLVASSDTAADPSFYFKARRPPLLKDFFDPKIRKVHRIRRLLRAVEISFKTREFEMEAFDAVP